MIMKLGMEHYKLQLYTFYINEDPEMALTYFTTKSILENFDLYYQLAHWQISGERLQYNRSSCSYSHEQCVLLCLVTPSLVWAHTLDYFLL